MKKLKETKQFVALTINQATPYAIGVVYAGLGYLSIDFGASYLVAVLIALSFCLLRGAAKALRIRRGYLTADDRTLPIKIQRDAAPELGLDEVPIPPYNDRHDGKTLPIKAEVVEDLPPVDAIPLEAWVEIKEDEPTKPSIVGVKVFVNGNYIRTLNFPKGRRILENEEGMIRHARKYPDVADALRELQITSQTYKPGNGVFITAN